MSIATDLADTIAAVDIRSDFIHFLFHSFIVATNTSSIPIQDSILFDIQRCCKQNITTMLDERALAGRIRAHTKSKKKEEERK